MCRLSLNLGASTSWYPQGLSRPVMGLLYLVPFVTSATYMSHLQSFQVRWDNSIPLFLHAAIYLEVSLFRWTSQNAFSRETAVYKWYCVQCCMQHCTQYHLYTAVSRENACSIAHSIIFTRLFRGKMHSDWFNGIEILQGRWQHGEKVRYCYPSGLERLFVSGTYICAAGHERVN